MALLGGPWPIVASIVFIPLLLLACWVSVAAQIRRWHDLNRRGWMILISFVPVVGFIANVIVLGFIRGTAGENRFGPGEPNGPASPRRGSLPPLLSTEPGSPPPASPDSTIPHSGSIDPVAARPLAQLPAKPSNIGRYAWRSLVAVAAAAVVAIGTFLIASPHGDWGVRRQWLRAELGSARDCVDLAWRYREGEGLPQNYAKAEEWFARAAAKGDREAQYDAAVLLYYGLGVPADTPKAVAWLDQSARLHYAPASTLLGIIENEQSPISPHVMLPPMSIVLPSAPMRAISGGRPSR